MACGRSPPNIAGGSLSTSWCRLWESGAQGRDRTADTAIFSRMLYQLSYLGLPGAVARNVAAYKRA